MGKLALLKENEEDFEWYPTTDEIMGRIRKDIFNIHKLDKYRYSRRNDGVSFDRAYKPEDTATLHLDSFLDIGAGDGRVFKAISKEVNRKRVSIRNLYGIEKATAQGDDLIKNDVALIGRDYFETALIDRHFTCVFSNPPYSQYKEWCIKLVKEVNAKFIYLVIPQRWKLDPDLKQLFDSTGETSVIGSFDFTDGERAARSRVDIVKIMPNEENDTFRSWIEDNIGKFERNDKIDLDEKEEARKKDPGEWYRLKEHNDNTAAVMVENYVDDLQNLMATFKSLGSIDWSLISQLGVSKDDVIGKVKSDIGNLKHKYWRLVVNNLNEITSRLTHNMRNTILSEIRWFEELDFNENNIRTIVIWIIKNFNKYTRSQMLEVYDKLTNFETVRAYKSNDKWLDDGWRYSKKKPEKYVLDYRIVVHIGYQLYYSSYSQNVQAGNPIENLSVVARSLGFDNWGVCDYETGEKHYCRNKDDNHSVLFEYKIYKNNNVHFKLNKEFLRVLNIEVGKERGWLKKPVDIQEEFDLSAEEAEKFFINENLSLISNNDLLLLT